MVTKSPKGVYFQGEHFFPDRVEYFSEGVGVQEG